MSLRLLIVDGSHLTAWLVAQVAPPGVEIARAETFGQAMRLLDQTPPDAAIFNLTPCHLEWRSLLDRCDRHSPPIPYVCTSVFDDAAGDELQLPCLPGDFCPKSLLVSELRTRVEALVRRAVAARDGLRHRA